MLLRMHYIDFIDRMYILQLRMISKRVEGNAGQILDEAPKNKPYKAMKAGIFPLSDWRLFLRLKFTFALQPLVSIFRCQA